MTDKTITITLTTRDGLRLGQRALKFQAGRSFASTRGDRERALSELRAAHPPIAGTPEPYAFIVSQGF